MPKGPVQCQKVLLVQKKCQKKSKVQKKLLKTCQNIPKGAEKTFQKPKKDKTTENA